MKLEYVAVSVLALALGAACASAPPPRELVDARMAYGQAAQGPAAQVSPADLHTAKVALDRAEVAYKDDGDSTRTKDLSYVAMRKAELADSAGRAMLALKAKDQLERDAVKTQAASLDAARSDLASTQQNLSKTQEQLDHEKQARAEAELKAAQALASLQKIASVKQEQRGIVITLSGAVLFETDKSTLLPTAQTKLAEVADALIKGNPDSNMTIEGHTDSQGQRQYNMELSQKRAESVKAQLVSRGVAADRIKTVGVGPDRPIADNKTPEGRANNRRVEIVVDTPNGARRGGPTTK